jgi:hypothetical protein
MSMTSWLGTGRAASTYSATSQLALLASASVAVIVIVRSAQQNNRTGLAQIVGQVQV